MGPPRGRPAVPDLRRLGGIPGAVALLVLCPLFGRAADLPRVGAVEVIGATRSSRDTVLTVARVREGDPWREGLDAEVLQNLRNSPLFYDVAVEVNRAARDVDLVIRLRDKWTLVPVPFAMSRGGDTSYGLTLMESNLFGMGSSLFLSALVTDGVFGGSLFFVDPHVAGSRWSVFASGGQIDNEVNVWNEWEKTGSYRQRSTGVLAALGYRFAERTTASLGFRLYDEEMYEATAGTTAPADARRRAISVSLIHEGANRFEERSHGTSGRVTLEQGLEVLGDQIGATTVSGEVRAAFNPLSDQTLLIVARGFWTDQPAYESSRTASFMRGYESGRFRPDRLLGGSLDYQVPVLRLREVKLSLVPFADGALLRDEYRSFTLEDFQLDAGVALGVYLRRIALPLIQITVAYGFDTQTVVPGFSLGFAF